MAGLPAAWQQATADGLCLPCLISDQQLVELLSQAKLLLQRVQRESDCGTLEYSRMQASAATLQLRIHKLLQQVQQQQVVQGLSFVWVESQLVTAIKEGHWVSAKRCKIVMVCRYWLLQDAAILCDVSL
jgi:hypothetical protein